MENNQVALPYSNLIIDGGNPSASDIVNLINPSGPVTVNLGNDALSTNTTITGFGGTITLQGDEVVNLNLDGQTLTVNGATQPENISYTPTGPLAGTVTATGLNTTFNFSNVLGGEFTIDPGSGGNNTVTVNGTTGDDNIAVDGNGANSISVFINALAAVTINEGDTQSLVIEGGAGNDNLVVNSIVAPVTVPITYDGGSGQDSLTLTGGAATLDTYTPGPIAGSGNSTIVYTSGGGGIQVVNFQNIEPVFDNVTSTTATINGTNADNAINYTTPGFNDQGGGLVTIDDQEGYFFSNKTHLVINAGAGDDVINLNGQSVPPGLLDITVNGSDPTASDTLIVNGTSGVDSFDYNPNTIGAGAISNSGLQPPIYFDGIEAVTIDGQGGGDSLHVVTPGDNNVKYTPSIAPDAGSVSITATNFGGGTDTLVPLTFQHLGPTGNLTFATVGGSATDILYVYGTNNSDQFVVAATTGAINLSNLSEQPEALPMNTPGITRLNLLGLDGDDNFIIGGPQPYEFLSIDGGNPSASDSVNLSGATGTVTVNLPNTSSSTPGIGIGGYGGEVDLTGIEIVNADANGHAVIVTGTTGADNIAVTPTASNAATVQAYSGGTAQNSQGGTLASMAPVSPTFNFSGVSTSAGGFTITGNGGSDQLFVEGTQNADTIDVNDAASGANAVKVNSLLTVNYNAAMPHVEVDSLAGSDTINIAPSTTTTFTVDGGDPIGVLPGDVINLIHPAAVYQLFPGPTKDSGGLNTAGFQTISWVHIETITNTGGTPLITGTNGNDIITIIARDSSYNPSNPGVPNPLLDGIQDFTVSVNDGAEMLFVNTPNLLVDALAGNDQIHVQEPAPNSAAWNTQVFVAGGTPSAGTGNVGDQIVLETPGAQNVIYAPDENASAIPAVPGVTFGTPSPVDSAQFNDTTNTSKITATTFAIAGFYQSSPGGVENFVYQGDGGGDNLTYLSPNLVVSGSQINYTPGATQDSGAITAAGAFGATTLVPLTFQGLGIGSNTITFSSSNPSQSGRVDSLTINGSTSNDVFVVNGPGDAGAGTVQLAGVSAVKTLLINTPGIAQLDLNGAGGTDYFSITGSLPYTSTTVEGSDPILSLSGATGAVTVNLGNDALSTNLTTITGYGGTVTLVGIDTANLDAGANTVTVNGASQPEAFNYTPTGTNAATLTDSGTNTVFNFANVSGAITGFKIDPLGGADTLTVNGTSSNDSITALTNGADTTVRTNGLLAVDTVTTDTESLVIASGNGNDSLNVNATNGPVLVPIVYDGGAGQDLLELTGGTASVDTYAPGPTPGAGNSTIVFTSGGGGTQMVNFMNIEPVQDDVTAGVAVVVANNATNAINYSRSAGFNDHSHTGLVSIDNQETYEFTNKTHLVIDALAGSDEINLNNPDTPTGLTDITVNGSDPTASDQLIVNGTSGNDAMNYSPSAAIGGGTVQVNALPTIIFNTIEGLKIDGQGGADALTLTTPAGADNVIYTPGPTPDAGSMSINAIVGGLARVPVSFTHITGGVTFASSGGREDNVDILGTSNSDVFTANGPADTVQITDRTTFNAITEVLHTGGASILQLSGLSGDDVFNAAGLMAYSLILDGGDPSGSDTANLSGATGLVTVNMLNPAASSGPATLTSITGYTAGAGSVFLTGVEVANLNTNTFGLTVNGNSSPNSFTYIPTGPAAGTFSETGINTVFNFTNTAGTFTINGSAGSTSDQVTLQGTASRDLISIDQGARTATLTNVANVVYKTVTLGPNIQVLTAQGLSGQDTFLVTPAPGTQFPQSQVNPVGNTNNLLIDIDGGGNSSGENNALVIATQAGGALPNTDFVVVNRGADGTSGTVRTFGQPAAAVAAVPNIQYPDINYVNIQTVSPNVGTDPNAGPFLNQPNLLILGPDLNEPNQNPVNGNPFNATFLGSGPTINLQNAAIFPNNTEFPFVPADQDYYRVVAQNTGTLDFQVYFNLFDSALFPAGGNLNIQVLDVNGNVIASAHRPTSAPWVQRPTLASAFRWCRDKRITCACSVPVPTARRTPPS